MRNTRQLLAGAGVVGLVAGEVGAIAALHRLGRHRFLAVPHAEPLEWLRVNPPEDTIAALLRLVALLLAYWLAATTALYMLARMSRVPEAVRAVEWATLPAVRRVVDRAAALALTTATLTGPVVAPALASDRPPPIVFDIDGGIPTPRQDPIPPPDGETAGVAPPGVNGPGYTPRAAGRPAGETAADAGTDTGGGGEVAEPGEQPAAPDEPATHTVVSGDNLWCISQARVEAALGDTVPTAVIAEYWRAVIAANADHLRSGDPDLIYPGEVVVLPPLPAVSTGNETRP